MPRADKGCQTSVALTDTLLGRLAATAAELRILRQGGAALRAWGGNQRTPALLTEACTLHAHHTAGWAGKPGIVLRRGHGIAVSIAGITIAVAVMVAAVTAPHSLAMMAATVTAQEPFQKTHVFLLKGICVVAFAATWMALVSPSRRASRC